MPMVREEYAEPQSFARLLSSIDAAWIEEATALGRPVPPPSHHLVAAE